MRTQYLNLGILGLAISRALSHAERASCYMAILPVEVRDRVHSHLDLPTYSRLLNGSSGTEVLRASAFLEQKLLREALIEMTILDDEVKDNPKRRRIQEILASAQALLQRRLNLPLHNAKIATNDPRNTVDYFLNIFYSCVAFSPHPKWVKACFGLLINAFDVCKIYPQTSNEFRALHHKSIIRAAASEGNYNTLKFLISFANLNWVLSLRFFASDVAQHGSALFLDQILEIINVHSFPDNFSEMIVKYNNLELLASYQAKLYTSLGFVLRREILKLLEAAYRYGAVDSFRWLAGNYAALWKSFQLVRPAMSMIRSNNLPMFQALLWDFEGSCVRENNQLTSETIFTLMECAAQTNRGEMLHFLLDRFTFLLEGYHPLLKIFAVATMKGQLGIVELLLGRDSNGHLLIPDLHFSVNRQILRNIAKKGQTKVIEYFAERQEIGDGRFRDFNSGLYHTLLLQTACQCGQLSLTRLLLSLKEDGTRRFVGINPAAKNNRPLIRACRHGHLDIVLELLKQDDRGVAVHQNVDPAARNNKPLIVAGKYGHFTIVEYLLQLHDEASSYRLVGIDPSARDSQLLRQAIRAHNVTIIVFLARRYRHDGPFVLPGMRVPDDLEQSLQDILFTHRYGL